MTRDQMHNTLRYVREQLADERGSDFSGVKALDMVLEELEQEPSGDLISRQDAIDAIWDGINMDIYTREVKETLEELPSVKQEPSVEIVKTEESNDNDTKYLNINVSDDEVKRNPDIVRLCSDVGILEYAKPQTGHWITKQNEVFKYYCDKCGTGDNLRTNYCPNCGARMVEPQESEDKE